MRDSCPKTPSPYRINSASRCLRPASRFPPLPPSPDDLRPTSPTLTPRDRTSHHRPPPAKNEQAQIFAPTRRRYIPAQRLGEAWELGPPRPLPRLRSPQLHHPPRRRH